LSRELPSIRLRSAIGAVLRRPYESLRGIRCDKNQADIHRTLGRQFYPATDGQKGLIGVSETRLNEAREPSLRRISIDSVPFGDRLRAHLDVVSACGLKVAEHLVGERNLVQSHNVGELSICFGEELDRLADLRWSAHESDGRVDTLHPAFAFGGTIQRPVECGAACFHTERENSGSPGPPRVIVCHDQQPMSCPSRSMPMAFAMNSSILVSVDGRRLLEANAALADIQSGIRSSR
jgi:hypothetical protein